MKTRRNLNKFFVMSVFLLATPHKPATGATLYVPSSSHSTIQDAIDAAVNGDEIEVAPGTYLETINFNGKAIRLYSSHGAAATAIDGGGAAMTLVVQCRSGEGADTILEGFTITGGNGRWYGGGMYNDNNSNPTVISCTFTGNVSGWGGAGMVNWQSSPTVIGCTFSGNSGMWGGGMFNRENSPTVTNCTFTDNSVSKGGGGMYNWTNSSPIVTNCTFIENFADGSGGGMSNGDGSNPIVNGCTFNINVASYHGGGMHNYGDSSPTITDCTFNSNSAGFYSEGSYKGGRGGGMYNINESNPVVTGCTFSSNSGHLGGGMSNNKFSSPTVTDCMFSHNSTTSTQGGAGGGGMYNDNNCTPVLINCTFIGNTSSRYGGAIYNYVSSNPIIDNCTFTYNSAVNNGGCMYNRNNSSSIVTNCILWGDAPDEIYLASSTLLISYSDVQGGTSQPWFGMGCIDTDPIFADSDGRLSVGSPCIDAGDNSTVVVSTDLDGYPRIVGLAVDMGAYEFQEPAEHAAAKTEQLVDEVVDLNLQQGIENNLVSKLDAVSRALDDGNENNDIAAVNVMQAFINTVEAQRGKKITNEEADELIDAAQEIIDLLLSQ